MLSPVLHLPVQLLALQPPPLPLGEICVLDRQFLKRCTPARDSHLIKHAQFILQHTLRPTITDDVMRRHAQHVFVDSQPHQYGADQWPTCEIELTLRFYSHTATRLRFSHSIRGWCPFNY